MSETARDEARIRHHLDRLIDAKSDWNHLAWRADNAKKSVMSALRDLKAAGGIEEAERVMGADFK